VIPGWMSALALQPAPFARFGREQSVRCSTRCQQRSRTWKSTRAPARRSGAGHVPKNPLHKVVICNTQGFFLKTRGGRLSMCEEPLE
jgi:hypothetical protein